MCAIAQLSCCGCSPIIHKLQTVPLLLTPTAPFLSPLSIFPFTRNPPSLDRALQTTKIGHVTVLPGTIVQIAPPLLHFEEKNWGADAREFKPERFRGEWF